MTINKMITKTKRNLYFNYVTWLRAENAHIYMYFIVLLENVR